MLHILNTSKEGFVANILFCEGCKKEMNTLNIMLVKFQVNIQNMDMNFLCAPLCVQLLDLGEYPIQLWQHMATIANRMAMTATMHKPYMRHPYPSLCIAPICVLAILILICKVHILHKVPQHTQGAVSTNGESRLNCSIPFNASPKFYFSTCGEKEGILGSAVPKRRMWGIYNHKRGQVDVSVFMQFKFIWWNTQDKEQLYEKRKDSLQVQCSRKTNLSAKGPAKILLIFWWHFTTTLQVVCFHKID